MPANHPLLFHHRHMEPCQRQCTASPHPSDAWHTSPLRHVETPPTSRSSSDERRASCVLWAGPAAQPSSRSRLNRSKLYRSRLNRSQTEQEPDEKPLPIPRRRYVGRGRAAGPLERAWHSRGTRAMKGGARGGSHGGGLPYCWNGASRGVRVGRGDEAEDKHCRH